MNKKKELRPYSWAQTTKQVNGCFSYRRTDGEGKKVPPGLWACYYRGPGQLHRRSGPKMGFESQEAALKWRTDEEAKNPSTSEAPLFGRACETYVAERLRAGKKASSYQLMPLWSSVYEQRKLDSIKSVEIQAQLDAWQAARGWTNATRNRALAQFAGLMSWAYGRQWISHHPTEHNRVAQLKEAGRRSGYLTPAEIQQAAAHAEPWLANALYFMGQTGVRLGEIDRLTKADFQQVVPAGSTAPVPAVICTDTKNGSTLVYPLHGWSLEHIKARVDALTFPAALLFPGPDGGHIRMSLLRRLPPIIRKIGRRWGKYLLEADGKPLRDSRGNKVLDPEGLTTHSLRASMATAAGEAGLPIESVMLLGNWKSERVARGYRRTTSGEMVAAAAAMANIIKPRDWEPSDKDEKKQKEAGATA